MKSALALGLIFFPLMGVAQPATPRLASGTFEHEIERAGMTMHGHKPLKVLWKINSKGQSISCSYSTNITFKIIHRLSTNFDFIQNKYYRIDHEERTINLLRDSGFYYFFSRNIVHSSFPVGNIPKLALVDSLTTVAGIECNHFFGDTVLKNPFSNEMVKLYYDVYVAKHLLHPQPISSIPGLILPLTIPNIQGVVMHLNITERYGVNFFSSKCVRYIPDSTGTLDHKLPDYPIVPIKPPNSDTTRSRAKLREYMERYQRPKED